MSRINVYPSWYVREDSSHGRWTEVTECPDCMRTGHRDDCHPVHPCPNCGGENIKDRVGRWVKSPKPWWAFWYNEGHWQIKEKDD